MLKHTPWYVILTLFERAGKMNAVGYSYDRKYFYTGINDQGLKLWDAETYTLVRHFNPI